MCFSLAVAPDEHHSVPHGRHGNSVTLVIIRGPIEAVLVVEGGWESTQELTPGCGCGAISSCVSESSWVTRLADTMVVAGTVGSRRKLALRASTVDVIAC